VDLIAGFDYLSPLNANLGYHQILMHLENKEKTSFITKKGTFCYEVMAFGLKNTGAIYQCIMNKYLKDIGKNKEAYINDMLVKNMTFEQHLHDLQEVVLFHAHIK
jgi:hypothetical protein